MQQQYDNTNKGGLWNNPKAQQNPKAPHFNGKINVGGKEYWIAMWNNNTQGNAKAPVFKVQVTDPDTVQRPQGGYQQPQQQYQQPMQQQPMQQPQQGYVDNAATPQNMNQTTPQGSFIEDTIPF